MNDQIIVIIMIVRRYFKKIIRLKINNTHNNMIKFNEGIYEILRICNRFSSRTV